MVIGCAVHNNCSIPRRQQQLALFHQAFKSFYRNNRAVEPEVFSAARPVQNIYRGRWHGINLKNYAIHRKPLFQSGTSLLSLLFQPVCGRQGWYQRVQPGIYIDISVISAAASDGASCSILRALMIGAVMADFGNPHRQGQPGLCLVLRQFQTGYWLPDASSQLKRPSPAMPPRYLPVSKPPPSGL